MGDLGQQCSLPGLSKTHSVNMGYDDYVSYLDNAVSNSGNHVLSIVW